MTKIRGGSPVAAAAIRSALKTQASALQPLDWQRQEAIICDHLAADTGQLPLKELQEVHRHALPAQAPGAAERADTLGPGAPVPPTLQALPAHPCEERSDVQA